MTRLNYFENDGRCLDNMAKKKINSKKKCKFPPKKVSATSALQPMPPHKNNSDNERSGCENCENINRYQKWILLMKVVRQRFFMISKCKFFRLSAVCVLGLFLITVGFGYCFANRIVKMPSWSKVGPGILIACDKPYKGVVINSETDGDGTTKLFFFQKDATEIMPHYQELGFVKSDSIPPEDNGGECHFWVCIRGNTPINWSIDDTENVDNYQLTPVDHGGGCTFHVEKTNFTSGSDCVTVFCISLGGGNYPMACIKFSEISEYEVCRANGYYHPRLPWITPWFNDLSKRNQEMRDDFRRLDGNVLNLSLNGQNMYLPFLEISTYYAPLELMIQHDLEISLIDPEPQFSYPTFLWTSYGFLSPTVQFHDKHWESTAQKNNLLGGVFIGLGVNVLLTFWEFFKKKRRW